MVNPQSPIISPVSFRQTAQSPNPKILYLSMLQRPLSSSTEALKKMEAERRPLYLAAADAVIPNSGTVEDAVTAAMEALDEIFSH